MKKGLLLIALLFSITIFSQDKNINTTIPAESIKIIKRESNNKQEISNTIITNSQQPSVTSTGSSTETSVTQGELSVSLTGGATYTIPIATPPGINGVAPKVALSYNSQSTNGLAGYGWNLSGLSSITRIPTAKYIDGIIDGVDFDNLDRFSLDGQRLLTKNGTSGVYGANGTVYETENYSTTKITSYGVHPRGANFGPAYFKVEYADGSIAEYGSSDDSRTIVSWNLRYWKNPQGLTINYIYENENNNTRISSIIYGGSGISINLLSSFSLQFDYKARQRPEEIYVGGEKIIDSKILNAINVISFGTAIRKYELNYDTTYQLYERLIKITEKSGDGSKSYNPTVFSYDTTPENINYVNETSTISMSNVRFDNSVTVSGDFDGDGKVDFLLYPKTGIDAKNKYWLFNDIGGTSYNIGAEHNVGKFEEIFPVSWLNSTNKMMPFQGWCVAKNNNSNCTFTIYCKGTVNPIYTQYTKTINFPTVSIGDGCGGPGVRCSTLMTNKIIPKKILSGDFNGDGLTDVIAIDNGRASGAACYEDQRTGRCLTSGYSSAPSKKVYFIDLKNDGTNGVAIDLGELPNYITSSIRIDVTDFDGDGKSDFTIFESGKATTYTLNSANQLVLLNTYIDGNIVADGTKPILLGDYNGDGKTDFIIPYQTGYTEWYKYTATGTGYIKELKTFPSIYFYNSFYGYGYNHYLPTDFDNDGKTDLVVANASRYGDNTYGWLTVVAYLNKNGNFSRTNGNYFQANSTNQAEIDKYALPFVYNSNQKNKKLEIGFINNNKLHYFKSQKDFSLERLLRGITVGNGVTETITYKSMSSDYGPTSPYDTYVDSKFTENYPNFDIAVGPTFQLVSKIEKRSATTYKKQLFTYYGAVSNAEGQGFIGFRATARTNWHTDASQVITTISKANIALRGAINENISVLGFATANFTLSGNNYISRTLNTYNSYDNVNFEPTLLPNKVFNLKNTISKTFNGLDNTSVETIINYDTYNNVTNSKVITRNNVTVEGIRERTVVFDNQPLATPYYLGRGLSATNSVIINPGQPNQDTTSSEELYTYTNHLLTQIKKKGNGTNYLIEDNVYDAVGNLTQKTVSATGLSPRKTSYEYDSSGRFLSKSIDVEGIATNYTYDNYNGWLLSEEKNGLKTLYEYDIFGKKIKTTDYLGKKSYIAYSKGSNVNGGEYLIISRSCDDGSENKEFFDDLGNKTKEGKKDINGNWSFITYQYDDLGRNTKVSEPYFNTPSLWNETKYDSYGRIDQKIAATGKTLSFTYTGLTTAISDGVKTKSQVNNALERVVSSTDTPGGTIYYDYYANGNLKTSNYQGTIIAMEYDGWGKKTKLIDPTAGTYTYTYNDFGELTAEQTPKGTTYYRLNNEGKLIEKTIVSSTDATTNSSINYNYDNTTKLLTSTSYEDNINGTLINCNYNYDSFRRLIKSTEENIGKTKFEKIFEFDGFGRISRESYMSTYIPTSQTSQKWTKNTYKNGFSWQILDDATNQVLWETSTVNERGQVTKGVYGNGIIANNSYDGFGYINQIKHDSPVTPSVNVLTLNYNYDIQRGLILSRTNSLFNTTENFKYDNLDRLIEWGGTPRELFNFAFNQDIESFTNYNSASVIQNSGRLKIATRNDDSGVKRLLINNSDTSTKLKISGKIDTGISAPYNVRFSILEENPSTGSVSVYPIGMTKTGILEGTHQVRAANNTIYLVIDRVEDVPFVSGLLREFFIDDIKIIKTEGAEKQSYDDSGRITSNNLGDYNYTDNTKLYKNTSVTNSIEADSYYTQKPNHFVVYNAFKSPVYIEEQGVDKINFVYGGLNSRVEMYSGSLDDDKLLRPYRKFYSSEGVFEVKQDIVNNKTTFITYIGGDGYTAPVVLKGDGTTQEYLYLHRDNQGSIITITNQNAIVAEKRLFDAWGSVAKIEDGNGNVLASFVILDRGYTGHEHLFTVGLINMNGRLYDPKLHRFLQPDNNIQDPYNTQNYNRYGYVLNNPLLYVDITGESFASWWNNNWKTVVTIAAAVGTAVIIGASMGTATPFVAGFWSGAGAGFVGGALGTALNGGNVGDIISSGLQGAAFGCLAGGVGGYLSSFAPLGAFGGALFGGTSNVVINGVINVFQGNHLFHNAGLSFGLGAIGGGIGGYRAARAQGLNGFTGAKPRLDTSSNYQPNPLDVIESQQTAQTQQTTTVNEPVQQAATPPAQSQTIKLIKGIDGKVKLSQPIKAIDAAEDLVQVRHHTSKEGLAGIKKSGSINASRGEPYGVDVEVAPFLKATEVHMGQFGKSSFIEFTFPKDLLSTPPTYMGGAGNAARIVTEGAPLNLNGTEPVYYKWNWFK